MSVRDLPTLNAVLNAVSAILLSVGYVLIRQGRREAHRRTMLAAVSCSALFLASYLTYHFQVGSVRFQGRGFLRVAYFTILLSHTLLAVLVLPLVLVTLRHALAGRFERHRKLARVTLPVWGYVSITGVVVYWLLYRR